MRGNRTVAEFTPKETQLLELLSDGKSHLKTEIQDKLDMDVLHQLMTNLRRKLNPIGQDIVCTIDRRRTAYQHVRLLANPYNGAT